MSDQLEMTWILQPLAAESQDRIIIDFLNFGIVEDCLFSSSFLHPNFNFTERIPIADILYGNTLQFRIEGFGFGLIDMASSWLKWYYGFANIFLANKVGSLKVWDLRPRVPSPTLAAVLSNN